MSLALATETWSESVVMPECDKRAEQSVLAVALMNEKTAACLAAELRPEDFYFPSHGQVFIAIQTLLAEGRSVDPVILAHHLREQQWFQEAGGADWLHGLTTIDAYATRWRDYVKILKDHASSRAKLEIGTALIEGTLDAAEAIAALQGIAAGSASLTIVGKEFIDWPTFWRCDRNQPEWVYEGILARGRGHALYATHKEGKSLFMLFIAAQLATGVEPVVVIYLDYEMAEEDLYERLADMGYGPGTDLSRLKYVLLPTLPPLDTASGGRALMRLVDQVGGEWFGHHMVVVIDTTSRAISGEENSSDTFRDFHAHTGIELRRRGVTWARLDHAGKNPDRGQRGTSGKSDDVDVVWKLTRTQNGLCLRREVARMAWVPEQVSFCIKEEPLRYERVAHDWPAGTSDTAELLDRLGVPLDASVRAAKHALTSAGQGRRTEVVAAAAKLRREQSGQAQ